MSKMTLVWLAVVSLVFTESMPGQSGAAGAVYRIVGDDGQPVFHTIHYASGPGFGFDSVKGMAFEDDIVIGPSLLMPGRPVIDRIKRDDNSMSFHFMGEPPYDYAVEYTESLTAPKWEMLFVFRAQLTTIDVVVWDVFTGGPTRFYRLRKEPCLCN
jgi:hypothetical protein